jgi:hypothetical protein
MATAGVQRDLSHQSIAVGFMVLLERNVPDGALQNERRNFLPNVCAS